MPGQVPAVPGIDVVKALKRAGFEVIRVSGSHHVLCHADGRSVSALHDMGSSPYPMDMAFDLATHIRRLREELGWTQEDLAKRAHIDQADLSRIERGGTDPRWSTVNRIINALGETLEPAAAPTTTRPALTAETREAIRKSARTRRRDRSSDQTTLTIKR